MPSAFFTPIGGRLEIRLYGQKFGNVSLASVEGRQNSGAAISNAFLSTVLAPRGTLSNTLVCKASELCKKVQLGHSTVAMRGVNADGVILDQAGQSFWITPADCMVIIAVHQQSGTTICAHAGRASLIDTKHIQDNEAPRKNFSIVDSIVECFINLYGNGVVAELKFFLTGSIAPENFLHEIAHPRYGAKNLRLIDFLVSTYGESAVPDRNLGQMCLSEIAKKQLLLNGAQPHHIGFDLIDTYSDTDVEGKYIWWSNRRSINLEDQHQQNRNGILVMRKW